jgi:hypothetical protein
MYDLVFGLRLAPDQAADLINGFEWRDGQAWKFLGDRALGGIKAQADDLLGINKNNEGLSPPNEKRSLFRSLKPCPRSA